MALLALLLLGTVALSNRAWSMLALRRQQAQAASQDLSAALQTLQRLPRVMAGAARDTAEAGELTLARLEGLRDEAGPFCRLYWLDATGRPRLSSDAEGAPPDWLWSLASRRLAHSSSQVLRPLPPGLEAGRLSAAQLELESDTPALYLAVAVRASKGDLFLAQLDLQHVFGPWLKKRLERSPLGESLSGRLAPERHPQALGTSPPEPSRQALLGLSAVGAHSAWSWLCPTFFAESAYPFPALQLHLDNAPALNGLRSEALAAALAFGLLMAAFALAISATGRAVRREMEYAEARGRFTEMVSHELRTPLSAIAMYAEILREGLVEDPEKLACYHRRLAEQTERLKRLVEDVLTFSRLEGAGSGVRVERVDLAALLERVRASTAALGIPIETAGLEEVQLASDAALLEQILVNLVENAAKHAGTAEPVEIRAVAGPSEVILEVADRGPGVAPQRRREIFAPYARAQAAEAAKQQGVGLGLAVVERLAQALGGRVECLQRPGGGALFVVALPQRR
jgi:signal transduction histidine kinase